MNQKFIFLEKLNISLIISDNDGLFELVINHLREFPGLLELSIFNYLPKAKIVALKNLRILNDRKFAVFNSLTFLIENLSQKCFNLFDVSSTNHL